MACLVKGKIDEMHKAFSCIITLQGSEYKLQTPHDEYGKNQEPACKGKDMNFRLDVKKKFF